MLNLRSLIVAHLDYIVDIALEIIACHCIPTAYFLIALMVSLRVGFTCVPHEGYL